MLSASLSENIATARELFTIGKSFDYIERDLFLGENRAYLLCINGFTQTVVLQRIISDLQNRSFTKDARIEDCARYVNSCIGYAQVEFVEEWDRIEKMVLSGTCLLLFEGSRKGILMDTRMYPVRNTEEPDTEKVTRGARDGFVENFLVNTTLIRRRIRSPRLTFSLHEVGSESKSDVVVAYIDGKADKNLVDDIERHHLCGLSVIQDIRIGSYKVSVEIKICVYLTCKSGRYGHILCYRLVSFLLECYGI